MSSKKFSKKQSGFSLVEMLIALTVVGGVFAILYNFGKMNAQRVSSESNTACEQIARSSLDNLRSFGLERTTATIDRNNNLILPPTGSLHSNSILATDAWGGNSSQLLLTPNSIPGQPYISNFHLNTVGTMSTLAKLYASNTGFCTGSLPYNNAQLLIQGGLANANAGNGAFDRFKSVNTTLKIQSYHLATGDVGCVPFYPVPASADLTPTAYGFVDYPAGVTPDYGFWVTVNTSYVEANGNPGTCTASSLFQYPAKKRISATQPSGLIVPTPSSPAQCATTMATATATINMPANSQGKGWILLCQDGSTPGGLTGASCPGRVTAQPFPAVSTNWVDCRQVTLCGIAPSSSAWDALGASLVINYPTLWWGCRPQINVRAIDPAKNLVGNQVPVTGPSFEHPWGDGPTCAADACLQSYCGAPPICILPTPTPPPGPGDGFPSDGGDGFDGGDGGGSGTDGCD